MTHFRVTAMINAGAVTLAGKCACVDSFASTGAVVEAASVKTIAATPRQATHATVKVRYLTALELYCVKLPNLDT